MGWTLSAFADESGAAIDTQITALRDARISFVDLRTVGTWTITDLPCDEARAAARKLEDAGITVSMYGSPIGKIDIADDFATDIARLEHLADLAGIFGARAVRIFSYYNRFGATGDAWRGQSLSRLERLRTRASELGLVLYHENESGIYGDHPSDVLEIAGLRDEATFRTIYDFSNYLRTGVSGWQTWEMLRTVTDGFHLKDQIRDGAVVPIGHGDADAERILADAAASGWDGPCTVEPHLASSQAPAPNGSSGGEPAAFKELDPLTCFSIACREARALLGKLGVEYA
jgi:sugar phosphate isomerase/epimerase